MTLESRHAPQDLFHPDIRARCTKKLSCPWTQVIAKNMRSGGAIEPMIPGERVHAIFGFCDIRNFTDTTEVLQVSHGTMRFGSTTKVSKCMLKYYGT